jgi:glycosyltransferase involved in cell wall biosynthesis
MSGLSTYDNSPDPRQKMRVSVVIPTRDRPQLLERCLLALQGSLKEIDEILVCDSASAGAAVREVAERNGANYLRIERPGTSLARNAGWRAATHDVIAFVDDDIEVTSGWADAIRAAFEADPSLGLLTGRVDLPDKDADVDHPTSVEHHAEAHGLVAGSARPRGISGNCAVRREVLTSIGGFDEGLGPGTRLRAGEDKDLFDRILAGGSRGRYDPAVCVRHVQWRTRSRRLRLDWSYGIGAGARLAKVLRTDRRHARSIAYEIFVRWGFADLAACIRSRYKLGTAAAVFRVAGMVVGVALGLATPVRNGHYGGSGRLASNKARLPARSDRGHA